MRIITKRHWRGWNSNDPKESDWATTNANENWIAYGEQLESLRSRLSKKNFEFFKIGLHDARLISFSVGDGLTIDLSGSKPVTINDFVRDQGKKLLAIGGVADHIHILLNLKPSLALSDMVRDIKANSSRFVNEKGWVKGKFSWQEGFGAFSYSISQLDDVPLHSKSGRASQGKEF